MNKSAHHISVILISSAFLLVLAALINFCVDPAALFIGERAEVFIASTVANGKPIVVHGNIDERSFEKYRLASETNHHPDFFVTGSSRSWLIGEWLTGRPTVNAAVPGATLEDILAIISLGQRITPKTYVIGVDPWIFNKNNNSQSWQVLKNEYQEGLMLIGENTTKRAIQFPEIANISRISQLISFDYLRESIKQLRNKEEQNGHYTTKIPEIFSGTARLILGDGSRTFFPPGVVRSARQKQMEEAIPKSQSELSRPFGLKNFVVIDPDSFSRFLALTKYLRKRGNVIFSLAPYHPLAWERISRINAVQEVERRMRALAKSNGAQIIGSYDPELAGCPRLTFADHFHPNEECIQIIWNKERASEK